MFEGLTDSHIQEALRFLEAGVQTFQRGETIYHTGDQVLRIGIILEGFVDTIQEDFWGNQVLLGRFPPGYVFGDSFVVATPPEGLPFSAVSHKKSVVLFTHYQPLLLSCGHVSGLHQQLLCNLLKVTAGKNILLLNRINHLTQRTIREKLLAFFSAEALRVDSNEFELVVNRQGLANYLAVDRSALSSELSRMQRDGLIQYERNRFKLIPAEHDAYAKFSHKK